MTNYKLSYRFLNTTRSDTLTDLFTFYLRLSELMEQHEVPNHSIKFSTEDIIQPEPVFVSYPASKEEMEREREFQLFKGGRK